jgi:ferritin
MLSRKMQDAINEQINKELYSAYMYLSMAAYCEDANLPGSAHWMRAQANEEMEHAMKFFGYVNERGGRVILKAIDQPSVEFQGLLDVFERTLEHEQYVTSLIDNLYTLALEERDYASQSFLQWFIDEQVEEEASATEIVETLKMIGDKGHALVMLDRQLGSRGA